MGNFAVKGNRTVAKGDLREGCEDERHLRLYNTDRKMGQVENTKSKSSW